MTKSLSSKSYLAPLVTQLSIIVEPGQYMTRCGEVVMIDVTSDDNDFGCTGTYADGRFESWHSCN